MATNKVENSAKVFFLLAEVCPRRHRQARPHLELKTLPRFCPVSLKINGLGLIVKALEGNKRLKGVNLKLLESSF